MKKILRKMKRICRLSYNFMFKNTKRMLTMRIISMSAYIRMAILLIPMKKLEKHFGEMGKESPEVESIENSRTAFWLGYKVERVCDKTLWQSKCLVRALVAQRLLFQKGIHTTLYLGISKKDSKMTAHAWLRCGAVYVTGGNGGENTIVTMFYK